MSLILKKRFLNICFIYSFAICVLISIGSILFAKNPLSTLNERANKSLFCFILTSKNNFDNKTRAVHRTWATKCDNYKFISVIPDHIRRQSQQIGLNQVNYNGMHILQPPGLVKDHYDMLTDKVFLTIIHLHKEYGDYDWYLKADDDTFIFVDNLRTFVLDKDKSLPVTYGYDFKVIVDHGYHSGGGGYLLSNEALNRLGAKLAQNYTNCSNSGTEDVDVARCLRQVGVYPNKSLDNGRERFHPLDLMAHFNNVYPDWMKKYATNQILPVI